MTSVQDIPTYNLQAAAELTGVGGHSLRAWERRYGLPVPARTDAGHRLYSPNDIALIKWLKQQVGKGMAISGAVEMYKRLAEAGSDPAQVLVLETVSEAPLQDALSQTRTNWISAVRSFDERLADRITAQAFAQFGPEAVVTGVLQRGLAAIGELWYSGELTVQHEHFASELMTRRLEALLESAPHPHLEGRLLVGAPPGELHSLPLLLVCYLLRRRGRDVLFLGANVPLRQLEETLHGGGFVMAVTAAQQLPTAASLAEMAEALHEMGVPTAYGGRIFQELTMVRMRVRGHYLGDSLENVADAVEYAMVAPPLPSPEPVSAERLAAIDHYRNNAIAIEKDLLGWLQITPETEEYGRIAIHEMHRHVVAGLKLCDLAYVDPCLDWIETLMVNRGMTKAHLRGFLLPYLEATRRHLDARGDLIVEWLEQRLESADPSSVLNGSSNE